jgi:serine/threonine protein kinase
MIGTKLGHYEIRRHLGSGGMGEVYEAADSKLGRSVAVKFLPEEWNHDADRVARFQREARVLASLNHSGIAVVHGLEEADGRSFLVMELVDGQTLAERIHAGALPFDEALAIASEIADALEYAHERGIVHRDLKPANVKITPDGKVKLLDFGLAKALDADDRPSNLSNSPTLSMAATNAGVILGTAADMAPEQARGKPVDKRADIWAFGVLLYEMLNGKQLFRGDDLTETLAAVVKEQPTLEDVPARIRPVLRRCLQKDPGKRLRDISGFRLLMEDFPSTVVPRKPVGALLPWAIAGILAIGIVGVFLWVSLRKTVVEAGAVQFQIPSPQGAIRYAAISPDGRQLILQIQDSGSRSSNLWVRPIDSLAARELPGTENDNGIPFWLRDSRHIVFSSRDMRLKKVDVNGGPPTTLCNLPAANAVSGSENSDGVILFGTPANGVMRVSSSGGTCSAVTVTAGGNFSPNIFPVFLRDGHHFLYVRSAGQGQPSIFLGSIDLKPDKQEMAKSLISSVGNPGANGSLAATYVPGPISGLGQVLFLRENAVWAQSFDEKRFQATGEPVPIAEAADIFSASRDALTYLTGRQVLSQLTWIDSKGNAKSSGAEAGEYRAIVLSPNGDKAAVLKATGPRGNGDIWLVDLQGGRQEKFTYAGDVNVPLWSKDGRDIVYSIGGRVSDSTIYRRPADRSRDAEVLFTSSGTGYVTSLSPDGKFLLQVTGSLQTNRTDIDLISLESHTVSPLIATSATERNGRFSPAGKWLSYFSDESTRNEVYVRSFTPGAAGTPPRIGPPLLASKSGVPGSLASNVANTIGPLWRGDSRALAYLSPSGFVTVEMTGNPAIPFGEPQPFLRNVPQTGPLDITSDFQRVLAAQRVDQSTSAPSTVILNWQQLLKK